MKSEKYSQKSKTGISRVAYESTWCCQHLVKTNNDFSSKNNVLVYDENNQSTSINFLNFGSYYGSSSSVTTFLIGYTDTTSDYNNYLDLSGSNSQSQGKMTVIEFDSSVYTTGLYIDLSKIL